MTLLGAFVPYFAGIVTCLLAFIVVKHQTNRSSLRLPPGPKRLPLIGNLLDIPKRMEWLRYHAWKEHYGDVVYVEALGQKIVILGSTTAISDLMECRSSIYSSRPNPIMLNELCVEYSSTTVFR
jgi:hypothetical protein